MKLLKTVSCKLCTFEIYSTDTGYHKNMIIRPDIPQSRSVRRLNVRIPCDPNCDKKWCIKSARIILREVGGDR